MKDQKTGWSTYKRLLGYVKPYKLELGIGFASMLMFAVFQALLSGVAYVVVNGFVNKSGVDFSNLPHVPFLSDLSFSLAFVPFFVAGVFVFKGTFEFLSNYLIAVVGLKAVRNIRNEIYSHLHNLSLDFFSKGRTGDLMSRTISDVNHIQGAVTDVLVDMIKSPAVILFNIPMILFWGGKWALFAVIALPVIAVPVAMLGRKVRKFTRRSQESAADITSVFHEAITGVRVVKAFNQEKTETKKFKNFNENVFKYLKKQTVATILQGPIIEMLGGVAAAIGLWYGIQHLDASRLAGFLTALYVFYEPVKKISKVNSAVQRSIASGNRIFWIIDTPPSIADKSGVVPLENDVKSVEFSHVGFHYNEPDETGRRFALKDINFQVKKGEVIALVGSSGSGKTSLVNLLPRFYDVTGGAIKINGRDIRDCTIESLRDNIGVVTQEVVLFNNSVRENIAYGAPEASLDSVIKAAKAAHAHEFIERLDNGYDTEIGERGLQLSGGQRQRLSIARAILKSPPVLVFDEATSSLDTESEREIQKALDELMTGRTVFVIAHRLSTVQNATKIFVFENGEITQVGTHKELLAEGGQYKRLYELQFNA